MCRCSGTGCGIILVPRVPLFFVIFSNDLPDVVSLESIVPLYADDCKISKLIRSLNYHDAFEEDINCLGSWSQRNQMSFNIKKLEN